MRDSDVFYTDNDDEIGGFNLPDHEFDDISHKSGGLIHKFAVVKSLLKRRKVRMGVVGVVVIAIIAILLVLVVYGLPSSQDSDNDSSQDYAAYHAQYLKVPSVDGIQATMQAWATKAHLAGTDASLASAQYVQKLWTESGIPASQIEIVQYDVLLAYPISRKVAITAPASSVYECVLKEPPIVEDPTTQMPAVATFNGYSPSGNVSGELVYVNYGMLEDFQYLRDSGVDLQGKIALVRYGSLFRGTKVYIAQQFGIAAVLIYSDPIDDGIERGPTYPEGPWRPRDSVQRGSVQFLTLHPGDPTTPGYPSMPGLPESARVPINESNIPSIPVQPISANDAAPLLIALAGGKRKRTTRAKTKLSNDVQKEAKSSHRAPTHAAPAAWQGRAVSTPGFVYYTGPNGVMVNVDLEMNRTVVPIYNVIARINGTEQADREIIVGNHRDAWVYGGGDPTGGAAALNQVACGFGAMLKSGYKPKRTLVLASWDAEEYGLVGSTEWVEEHQDSLRENAVVYLNVDESAVGPYFQAKASPIIANAIRQATKRVGMGVEKGGSVFDLWLEQDQAYAQQVGLASSPALQLNQTYVGNLGSGSDFTPFMQFLGVSSFDIRFEGAYGVYHSIYDTYDWMSKFGDPGWFRSTAIAKVWGLVALEIADADVYPFDPSEYANQLQIYTTEVSDLIAHNASVDFDDFDMAPIEYAVAQFGSAALIVKNSQRLCTQKLVWNGDFDDGDDDEREEDAVLCTEAEKRSLNERLMRVDRSLIGPGLVGRPFYKHVVSAPSLYGGYSAQTFPGLTQAILDGNVSLAITQREILQQRILYAASQLLSTS